MTESFGAALRRVRGQAGLSLRGLQELTQYSAGYISELERGIKRPNAHVAGRLDEALGTNSLLTVLASAVVAAGVRRPALGRNTEMEDASIKEFAMAAEESAQFVRRAGTAPTRDLIDQIAAEAKILALDFLRKPPYAIFQPLVARRREVFTWLDGHVRPELLTDLYLVAGQLTALLAHASADLGQPFAAEGHARTAWMCADLAGHNPLKAYVRWVQSNIAYWTGDYASAAEIARQGEQVATHGSSLLRLASQQARSWAAVGDVRAVQGALSVAQSARDTLTPDASEVGAFWFNPGKSAYYAAEAWLSLGTADNARRAIADAHEAVGLLSDEPSPCAELIAAARLDLATAQLALEDLDAANEVLPDVLNLPAERRTVPVVERASKIGRSLTDPRYADVALSQDLRERIALFAAYPATRELTS